MKAVSENELNAWVAIATVFENVCATSVVEALRAVKYTSIDKIRQTYFEVVAPGMSLLRLTSKNRQVPFSRQEIIEACFQFYRPRLIRPLVQLFGKYICRKAGSVIEHWEELEKELLKQAEH